jgi:hypothetical protein
MPGYNDYLRWLYRHGRPNRFARWQNRASAWLFARRIEPRRVAALGVEGRRSLLQRRLGLAVQRPLRERANRLVVLRRM